MATLTAVVTSHANEQGLRTIIGNLLYQTRPADQLLVFASGLSRGQFCQAAEDFHGRAVFYLEDDQNDWGHAKRAAGIERASSDYLGFFNDDDSYELDYVEEMMGEAETATADVVYCGWNTYPECHFGLGSSTSGNFIVRTALARQVGYQSRRYEADGDFINAINEAAAIVCKVPLVLYRHNVQ